MKNLLNSLLLVSLSAMLFISCKKDSVSDDSVPMGTITGKVVAANHTIAIRVATVFINSDGKSYITQTDVNGSFTLDAPAGNRHLTIQTGDGSMFRTEMDVTITEGQTTAISSQAVQLTQVANLAYIAGTYDKIENILIDTMGYTATALTWTDAATMSNLTPYDAIFVNCTSDLLGITTNVDTNFADYVANGGSLYVSDWGVGFLMGKSNVSSDPCSVERIGGFLPDSLLCVRRSGVTGSFLAAPIVSTTLQAYLGKTSIDEIVYNLPAWEEIHSINNDFWETMVTNPAGAPLMIRTNDYTNPTKGTLSIGTPANNNYSLLCVQGAGSQHYTISVRNSDVSGLLSNGASMGSCESTTGSGRIYFTTFHNEPNGLIGADMKNIS